MRHILRCRNCCSYTLDSSCPSCNKDAVNPKPPKYSPDDKYASYRRKVKRDAFIERGFLSK